MGVSGIVNYLPPDEADYIEHDAPPIQRLRTPLFNAAAEKPEEGKSFIVAGDDIPDGNANFRQGFKILMLLHQCLEFRFFSRFCRIDDKL